MTSICFVHDAPLVKDLTTGSVYSQGFTYRVWQRYLDVFDSITVCTRMRYGDQPPGFGLASGEGVTFMPASTYENPLSLLLKFPSIYKQVASAVSQADTVLLRLPSMLGLLGYVAARRAKSEYIVELVGSVRDSYSNSGLLGILVAPLFSAVTRHIVLHAPYCIYVTEKYLQKHYPTRGSQIAISNVELDTSRVPVEQHRPDQPLRIGSTGQVDLSYKGYESVVSALRDLPDVLFEIAGGGDPSGLLAHAKSHGVQDQIRILGRLKREDLFDWLDTLDLYVQPSLTEGLPRAVLEAMSRRLPVIGSDVGGIPELLTKKYLFRPGDSCAIRDKIEEVLRDDDFAQIGYSNYRRAQDFDSATLQKRRNSFLSSFREHVLRLPNGHK